MKNAPLSLLEKIILGLVFLLANLRALVFIFLFPDMSSLFGPAWMEILLWILAAAGVIGLMVRHRQTGNFLALWRKNWLLGLFMLLAFLSILWSVERTATLFRLLEFSLATLVASYFGMRLSPRTLMDALFWFGAVLYILSIALVYGAPPTGTMYWAPFHGAWRGVYWHRNHLASITAFLSVIYLCRAILAITDRNVKGVFDGFFYFLSLVILYYARSATGYIVWIVLTLFLIIALIWLQVYPRLQRKHYFALLGVGILAAVLVLANLDFVFGLFNRNTTMTGRIPLWRGLLETASQRLWLGHGFGALWTMDSFRDQMMRLAGWTSQPLIGDNGFLDIFMHLGIAGLGLFLAVLILVAVRAARYALDRKSLAGFFPLMVVVYAVFANITLSLFAETEVFVWFLIVAALFMVTYFDNVVDPQSFTTD